jgi:hypothetical protein
MRIARRWYTLMLGELPDVSVDTCNINGTSDRHVSSLRPRIVMFSRVARSDETNVFAISAAISPILEVCVCMSSSVVNILEPYDALAI